MTSRPLPSPDDPYAKILELFPQLDDMDRFELVGELIEYSYQKQKREREARAKARRSQR